MDGTQGVEFRVAASGAVDIAPVTWQSCVTHPAVDMLSGAAGLSVRYLEDSETLVITKSVPGFDQPCIDGLRHIVAEAAAGRLGALKFLTFDFAHAGFPLSLAADGFDALLSEIADLILSAPVVSIASARANLAGADMELALACCMLIGEGDRRFSFAADPTVSISTYGLLARKIGFVRAERLMEKGDIIGAATMQDLYLLKEVMEPEIGAAGVEAFALKSARRHNACYGIYRAQRMANGGMAKS